MPTKAQHDTDNSPRKFLTGPEVQERYSISDVSLWRWLHDPKLNFPKPRLHIKRRRYWDETDLLQWERRSQRQPAAA